MRIVDLQPEHLALYLVCLEPWSADMRDAGELKARWYEREKERGLRVKLAIDDDGAVAGMIQYLPASETDVVGEHVYVVLCVWVHGHKEGIGDRRGHGLGKALLAAAEADARALGAHGIAAWGLWIPVWMRASWFRKHGYRKVDRDGLRALMFKPFVDDAAAPRWRTPWMPPDGPSDLVVITSCVNGWCPVMNIAHERMRRVLERAPERVQHRVIDTAEPAMRETWGVTDAIYLDGKPLRLGPPPSEERLAKLVAKRVRKVARA
jgi:N-acetylglutamate synthase-like GNAT family acetyltransferase